MKLLNFLINSENNIICEKIIDYLIDSGHKVYINIKHKKEYSETYNKYSYNFYFIKEDSINKFNINYTINLDKTSNKYKNIDALKINYILDSKIFQLISSIKIKENSLILKNKTINHSDNISLDNIIDNICETFIDSIIELSMNENFSEYPLYSEDNHNNFSEINSIILYKNQINDFINEFQKLRNKDKLFLFNNYEFQKFNQIDFVPDIVLNEIDFEILSIYLITLFNSRKKQIYCYKFHNKNIKFIKYFDIDLKEQYREIYNKIKNDKYKIFTKKIYNENHLFELNNIINISIYYNSSLTHNSNDSVSIFYNDNKISIKFNSNIEFFNEANIHINNLLEKYNEFKNNSLSFYQLSKLSDDYINKNIECFNRTNVNYNDDLLIHEEFERITKKYQEKIALIYKDKNFSYQFLNENANQAARLIKHNINNTETKNICVFLNRDENLIISILGIMKLGLAYVPIDLNNPNNRIRQIIETSIPSVIITNQEHKEKIESLCPNHIKIIDIDSKSNLEKICTFSKENLNLKLDPNTISYLIYTSGTTGTPKGVPIMHKSIINVLKSIAQKTEFCNNDCLLFLTTIAFDISVLEIFMPLIHGATVVILPKEDQQNAYNIINLIKNKNITFVQATTSLWSLITQQIENTNLNTNALCGGEELPLKLSASIRKKVKKLWNVYGPTETTIWSTIYEIPENCEKVFIGHPIANTKCYIVDDNYNLLPNGVIGQLAITGKGLSPGYFNKQEETNNKFVNNFILNERMYLTGDLAKRTLTGEIDYLGRIDFQIKLNGFRIELGEITTAIESYPTIKKSIAILFNEDDFDNKYLYAYYSSSEKINDNDLKNHLNKLIPSYMIPNYFIKIDEFPLNSNGKIDLKLLPKPITTNIKLLSPKNEFEKKLYNIWKKILNIKSPTENMLDDFFCLGGNSILAIKLVNKINTEFNSDIKIIDIFNEKTLDKISNKVELSIGKFIYKDYLITSDNNNSYLPFPLNNVQQTYYLGRFNTFDISNVATHIYTEFKFKNLDINRLEKSFNLLIQRHLALRSVFQDDYQKFLQNTDWYKIKLYTLNNEKELENLRSLYSHKVYDPSFYPLFDVFVSYYNNTYLVHVSFEAIIVDMGSFEILFKEWSELYSNLNFNLPKLNIDYHQYCLQYQKIRNSEYFEKSKKYWENKIDEYDFEISLPIKNTTKTENPKFKRLTKYININAWNTIKKKALQHNISPTSVVLEAYGRAVSYWCGKDKVCINLTLFNRLPFHNEINDIIGDFTVLELFNYNNEKNLSILESLSKVHLSLLEDIDNNLFDGVDFQRLVKFKKNIPANKILAPIVLTSVLNGTDKSSLFNLPLNDSYEGINFSISQTSQVWIDNKAYETQDGFVAEWDYVEQIFDHNFIQKIHDSYCYILEKISELDWHNQQFPRIEINTADHKLITDCNSSYQEFNNESLVAAIERQMKKKKLAAKTVVTEENKNKKYSYQKLFNDADILARYLLNHNPKSNQLIAVFAEKGYAQVLTTYAIMKSGYAFLPLSIDWPLGRIEEVIAQGNVHLVLTTKECSHILMQQNNLTSLSYNVIEIDSVLEQLTEKKINNLILNTPLPTINANNVAYVIFTSGTTGKPKGVTISHGSVLNTILAVNQKYQVTHNDSILALSDLSFDLAIYDIYGMLLTGGHIIYPQHINNKNPSAWVNLVTQHSVTLWNSVPQLANLFIEELNHSNTKLTSLRLFLLSGDWIPTNLPNQIKQHFPHANIVSLGGATEGSIWSIWYEINSLNPQWTSIPYGSAMPNQKMYVLRDNNEHCPIGVPGEIHIGGVGVALNYWGDETLTNNKFFNHKSLGRLYKTGDLGKWHENGFIQFLGRKDFQVKLNGYRVELEEITSKLLQITEIKNAAVKIQNKNNQNYLIAYVSFNTEIEKKESFIDSNFKLEIKGILKNTFNKYETNVNLNTQEYLTRKSYRNFLDSSVDFTKIKEIVKNVFTEKNISHENTKEICKNTINNILANLAAIQTNNKILPKYKYPSAGSSYSIRCFFLPKKNSNYFETDHYYYNPLSQNLSVHNEKWKNKLNNQSEYNELHFIVHWPAIEPLYQNNSKKLVLQELGHIVAVLESFFTENKINFETIFDDVLLDKENYFKLKLIIGTQKTTSIKNQKKPINYLIKERNNYFYDLSKKEYIKNIYNKISINNKNNEIIKNSKIIIEYSEDDSNENYIHSGYIFQKITTKLIKEKIGSCPIGFIKNRSSLYYLAIGNVSDTEINKFESDIKEISLTETINGELKKFLPNYMLPNYYVKITNFPLNNNGKLALDKIPEYNIIEEFIPPSNEIEKIICQIWSEILNLDCNKISVLQNFFSLGGNSLLAIQTIRKINSYFLLELKIQDIYKNQSITEISKLINQTNNSSSRLEGEI